MTNNLKAIIIDDDGLYSYLTKKIVEQSDEITVTNIFNSAHSAYRFLKENAKSSDTLPDIIILDLYMPFEDGWAFMEEFKQIYPSLTKHIKVFMSSSIAPLDLKRIKEDGFICDFIIKPINQNIVSKMASYFNLGEKISNL